MENMANNNSLTIINSISIDEIQKTMDKINVFHEIVKRTLIPDIDYGTIPGAKKPMLYKSGAENILMLFGIVTAVDIIKAIPENMDKDTNFISYTIKCRLLKDGEVISEGIGTCNTSERKYDNKIALDIANTVLKMACKRAMVDAVLHVASLSAVFAEETDGLNDYYNREKIENMTSQEASVFKINFGKHKGKTAGEVYKNHFDYVKWFGTNGTDKTLLKVFEVLSEAIKNQPKNKIEQPELQVSENVETYEVLEED